MKQNQDGAQIVKEILDRDQRVAAMERKRLVILLHEAADKGRVAECCREAADFIAAMDD